MTDQELAIRAGAGDQDAFEELADRLRGLAWSVSDRYFGPGLERDDLLQAALIGLWGACRYYDRRSAAVGRNASFAGFAALCMQRSVISTVKTATRVKQRAFNEAISLDAPTLEGDVDDLHGLFASRGSDPVETVLQREQLDVVVATIRDRLTPLERETAIGYMNGESFRSLEERLTGCSLAPGEKPKVVDNAIQRARRKVVEALGEDVRRRPLGVAA